MMIDENIYEDLGNGVIRVTRPDGSVSYSCDLTARDPTIMGTIGPSIAEVEIAELRAALAKAETALSEARAALRETHLFAIAGQIWQEKYAAVIKAAREAE